MSIFGNILDKIFHHGAAKAAPPPASNAARPAPAPSPGAAQPSAASPAPAAPPTATTPTSVEVGPVLEAMAALKSDHGGNYKTSIVDLLKLLDLDSSLTARKELAQELGVHAAEDGSAEQNMALHRAVMEKLAQNGGVVPDDLRH